MDTAGPPRPPGRSPSTRWSLIAGVYLLVWAAVLLVGTNQVTGLVAELLAVPSASALWLAAPVPVVGGGVWWAAVERRNRYTYVLGGAVGLVTALSTLGFWILRGASLWGAKGVLAGWPLIVAVVVPTVPVALLAGVSLMYARRRLDDGRSADAPAAS